MDELFGDPAPANDPAPADPAMPDQADGDLFGAPADPAPAPADDAIFGDPAPAADPFGAPAAPAPAVDNALEAPAPADQDIFGAPADPAPAPADDAIFGDPAPAAPADDIFGAPADPAADPAPAEEAPKDDLDNLFNSLDATPNWFEAPADAKPVSIEAPGDSYDELFGAPASESAVDSTPSATDRLNPPESAPSTDEDWRREIDDLFRSSAHSKQADAFRGAEYRQWIDNTGSFEVRAQLAVIFPDRVRLLKDNGKFSTVPLDRLSPADREYVEWVTGKLRSSSRVVSATPIEAPVTR